MLARPDNSGAEIGGEQRRHRRHGGRRPKPHLGQYRGHVQRGAPARRRRQQLQRPGQPDRHRRDRSARAAQRSAAWPPTASATRSAAPRPARQTSSPATPSTECGSRAASSCRATSSESPRTASPRSATHRTASASMRRTIRRSAERSPGEGNLVAYNGGFGVNVEEGVHNTVRGNSIHDNGSLGINLYTGGSLPKANDAGDVDNGSNNLQNFPILQAVTTGALDARRRQARLDAVDDVRSRLLCQPGVLQLPARIRRGPDVARHGPGHDRRHGPRRDRRDAAGRRPRAARASRRRRPTRAATPPSSHSESSSR